MIQYVVDGLVNGSIIALGAVGLSITYNVLRFANFAQGEILAIGAYMSMALIVLMGVGIGSIGPVSFGWPLLVSIAFSIVLTSVTVFGRLDAISCIKTTIGIEDYIYHCRIWPVINY